MKWYGTCRSRGALAKNDGCNVSRETLQPSFFARAPLLRHVPYHFIPCRYRVVSFFDWHFSILFRQRKTLPSIAVFSGRIAFGFQVEKGERNYFRHVSFRFMLSWGNGGLTSGIDFLHFSCFSMAQIEIARPIAEFFPWQKFTHWKWLG